MMTALVALVPLTLALILLTVFRQNSRNAGFVTLGSTILLVSLFPPFRLSPSHIALSLGMGVAGSLTLLTLLLPAIFLYQVQRAGGAMTVLIAGISRITSDRDLLLILLVFGLAPFLDAICGMNVGIFMIAPILLSLRMPPLRVACLTMISQITSVWGTMGVVILLVSSITGVPSAIVGSDSAILLTPITFGLCAIALLLSGRSLREIWRAWLPISGTAIILTIGSWITTRLVGVELVGISTSLVIIAFLSLVACVQSTRLAARGMAHRRLAASSTRLLLWKAGLPYAILTILLLSTRVITPLQGWLQTHVVLTVSQINLQFPVLYLPGFWMLMMACFAIILLRLKRNQIYQAASVAWKQFAPSALAIVSFLAAAQTMQKSGMIATFGGVAIALGTRYVWVSPWLGAFSGWATGSVISGNSLFASLQKSIALRTGLPVPWIIAAQNTASSLGKILSPTSAILSASAANIPGQEGLLLRELGFPVVWGIVLLMALLAVITCNSIWTLALLVLVISLGSLFIVLKQCSRWEMVTFGITTQTPSWCAIRVDPAQLVHLQMGQRSRTIIVHLAQAQQGMSRFELSVALGQPITVVHRLLRILQAQGYVQQEAMSRLYLLGPALIAGETPDR